MSILVRSQILPLREVVSVGYKAYRYAPGLVSEDMERLMAYILLVEGMPIEARGERHHQILPVSAEVGDLVEEPDVTTLLCICEINRIIIELPRSVVCAWCDLEYYFFVDANGGCTVCRKLDAIYCVDRIDSRDIELAVDFDVAIEGRCRGSHTGRAIGTDEEEAARRELRRW